MQAMKMKTFIREILKLHMDYKSQNGMLLKIMFYVREIYVQSEYIGSYMVTDWHVLLRFSYR